VPPEDRVPRLTHVDTEEDWERVIEAASAAQLIVSEAVLVGGSAAALHVGHRFSKDDDHVVRDLKGRFDRVLEDLEVVAGWKTARVRRPVLILGQLDGVDTGIRNLRRVAPLETEILETKFGPIRLPTIAEMLRIKAWLVTTRNATRDYVDVAALSARIEESSAGAAEQTLSELDEFYPQENGASVALQLAKQLADPAPYDLEPDGDLRVYRMIAERWSNWEKVAQHNRELGARLLRRVAAKIREA
jgi:hypothetical protein